jgi:hypothetical protein
MSSFICENNKTRGSPAIFDCVNGWGYMSVMVRVLFSSSLKKRQSAVSIAARTPRPIKIKPVVIQQDNIAKIPVIIRNRVIRTSSRHIQHDTLKHFLKHPKTSSKIPATITPMVIKSRGNIVASRKTPRPIRIRPNTTDTIQKVLFVSLGIFLTSFTV